MSASQKSIQPNSEMLIIEYASAKSQTSVIRTFPVCAIPFVTAAYESAETKL